MSASYFISSFQQNKSKRSFLKSPFVSLLLCKHSTIQHETTRRAEGRKKFSGWKSVNLTSQIPRIFAAVRHQQARGEVKLGGREMLKVKSDEKRNIACDGQQKMSNTRESGRERMSMTGFWFVCAFMASPNNMFFAVLRDVNKTRLLVFCWQCESKARKASDFPFYARN